VTGAELRGLATAAQLAYMACDCFYSGVLSVAQVEVYSTLFCPYCARAKSLLEKKGVEYVNIDVMEQPARRDEMVKRAGGRTSVPQIFIDGEHVGGSDDLHALERAGQLDAKLAS
jgi:glutaredoxin 3